MKRESNSMKVNGKEVLKIKRSDVFEVMMRCRFALNTKEQLLYFVERREFKEDSIEEEVLDMIAHAYQGVTNGFLTNIYEAITGEVVEVIGPVSELFPCPCCGRMTLTEAYNPELGTGWDICHFCKWEDDGLTEKDKDIHRSINRGSMEDYRLRIKENPNYCHREKWLTKDTKHNVTDFTEIDDE